jgi:hypothetical protein
LHTADLGTTGWRRCLRKERSSYNRQLFGVVAVDNLQYSVLVTRKRSMPKYKYTVRTAQGTNFVSFRKADHRMLCWRPVVVDCENYGESINRPLKRKPQLFC